MVNLRFRKFVVETAFKEQTDATRHSEIRGASSLCNRIQNISATVIPFIAALPGLALQPLSHPVVPNLKETEP